MAELALFCSIVGAEESAFRVVVKPSDLVVDLQTEIKKVKASALAAIGAMDLQLFLAKKDGEWLRSSSDEVKALEKGETRLVEGLLDETPLAPVDILASIFTDVGDDRVHVLAVTLESTPVLGKRLHGDEWPVQGTKMPKMEEKDELKLFCVAAGDKGGAFPVLVKPSDTVGDLQKAIKQEKANAFAAIDANELRLFLARRNSVWLLDGVDDVAALGSGDSAQIQDLLVQAMKPTTILRDTFAADRPGGTIHVLVVAPTSTGGKRIQVDEWFPSELQTHTWGGRRGRQAKGGEVL